MINNNQTPGATFQYKHPLKHVQLNELPKELYPQPMKKFNYNLQELTKLKKEIQQNEETVYKDYKIYKNYADQMEILENTHGKPYLDISANKYRSIPRHVTRKDKHHQSAKSQQHSQQVANIISKTEYLCKLQTESSKEVKEKVQRGQNFLISFYEQSVLPKDDEAEVLFQAQRKRHQVMPRTLHEQSMLFFADCKHQQIAQDIQREKIGKKIRQLYKNSDQQSFSHSSFVQVQGSTRFDQRQKIRTEASSDKNINSRNRDQNSCNVRKRSVTIVYDKVKPDTTLQRYLEQKSSADQKTFMPDQKQQKNKRSSIQSQASDSSEIQEQKRQVNLKKVLKTSNHHRIINSLNLKTKHLFKQWEDFKSRQQDFESGNKIKEKQQKIIKESKNFNIEIQQRLKEDFQEIIKMHQKQNTIK